MVSNFQFYLFLRNQSLSIDPRDLKTETGWFKGEHGARVGDLS
jgi:hypothetical protein